MRLTSTFSAPDSQEAATVDLFTQRMIILHWDSGLSKIFLYGIERMGKAIARRSVYQVWLGCKRGFIHTSVYGKLNIPLGIKVR